jgi:isopenicillin N synthase-like dioxygenase
MPELPIIDISPYLSPSQLLPSCPVPSNDRAATAKAIHQACRDVGFFYLYVGNYLEESEMREVLDVGREFFGRSDEEKEKIGLGMSDGVRGGFVG